MSNAFNILIIDDSPEDREVYKRLIRKCEDIGAFNVTEASSCEEGLSLIRSAQPDCVMLDYRLPDGCGLDFLGRAASIVGDTVLQVVMLTGQGSESVAVEAMKRGAADYLTKDNLSTDSLRRSLVGAIERGALHQRLQRAEADHREFAHTAAHDLRAPLRQIAQFGELLERRCAADLGEEGARYVNRIVTTAQRMTQMITDLLNYADVTAESASMVTVPLARLAEEALEALRTEIVSSGATVTIGSLPQVHGFPSLLRRMLRDLLAIAIMFRGYGAPWGALHAAAEGDEVVITVRDNGIGIAEHQRESIFKPFRRLHSRAKYEGNGIGLATCQRVAALHRGRIWVESELGCGATFFVALPHCFEAAAEALHSDVRPPLARGAQAEIDPAKVDRAKVGA